MDEKKTKHHRGRRKKNKKADIFGNIVLVIALAVFAVSAFQLYQISSEYNEGKSEYNKIQDIAIVQEQKEVEEEAEEEKDTFKIDFQKLLEINSDVVGWIRFEEPAEINYPVVQGTDNAKYLKKTFEANTNKLGTLFVDCENAGDFSDRNTIIYGHNMKNGSMFAQLLKYKKESFYKQYPYFYIYTPDGMVSKYQIFSAGVVKDISDGYTKVFEDDEAYQRFIDYIKQQSIYGTAVEVTTESQIVSLSTCTNVKEDERFLVHGVKISEEPVE